MNKWFVFIVPAMLVGFLLGFWKRGWTGWLLSAVLPVAGVFAFCSFQEFFVPYKGGGASFFPIDAIVISAPAFLSGLSAYALVVIIYAIRSRRRSNQSLQPTRSAGDRV